MFLAQEIYPSFIYPDRQETFLTTLVWDLIKKTDGTVIEVDNGKLAHFSALFLAPFFSADVPLVPVNTVN